jgi:hypothetical protein
VTGLPVVAQDHAADSNRFREHTALSIRRAVTLLTRSSLVVVLAAVSLLAISLDSTAQAVTSPSTAGTDFWVTYEPNLPTPTLSLSIAGATATSGTITWPDTTTTPFTVTPGVVTTVAVPSSTVTATQAMPTDGTVTAGIHITALAPVAVYGLTYDIGSSEAFVGLPTPSLGTRYRAIAYKTTIGSEPGRMIALATEDNTTITVTPNETHGARTGGTAYTVSLNAGQAYTLAADSTGVGAEEITGTLVTSDKPIAAFSGVDCGNIGASACDEESQELFPSTEWGTSFVVPRFDTVSGGDPVRVEADTANTVVSVGGTVVATLNAGQFYETTTATSGNNALFVTATHPVLVAQFMINNSYGTTGATGDPSMLLIPPYQQFLSTYTVATPGSGFSYNGINIAIPTIAISSLTLDGSAVPAGDFAAVPGTTFSVAQVAVAAGTHNLSASQPFGAFVYGANNFNSYAYAGGAGLSPVASVAHVTITAPTTAAGQVGHSVCFPVSVTDSSSGPVAGVRVDLTVTGTNAGSLANATTATNGTASVCYVGAAAGTDTVTLTSGTATATAHVTWTTTAPAPSAPAAPTVKAGDGQVTVSWTAPASNGAVITGYTVITSPGGATCTAPATARSCVVTGLTNGVAYTFTVVADGSTLNSAASAASDPATPSVLADTGSDAGQLTMLAIFLIVTGGALLAIERRRRQVGPVQPLT